MSPRKAVKKHPRRLYTVPFKELELLKRLSADAVAADARYVQTVAFIAEREGISGKGDFKLEDGSFTEVSDVEAN